VEGASFVLPYGACGGTMGHTLEAKGAVAWLQNGDRNTTYFDSVASNGKKHNTVKKFREHGECTSHR
jgi:hypothetical protein